MHPCCRGRAEAFIVAVDVASHHGTVSKHRVAAAAAADHTAWYLPEPTLLLRSRGLVTHYLPRSFHYFAGYTGIWYRYGYPLVPRFLVRLPMPTILLTSAANLCNSLACGAGPVEPEDAVA